MAPPIVITRAGMCTSVGHTAPAACAAIRAQITGFEETAFRFDGEWLVGAEVRLERPSSGPDKLLRMAESVVRECIEGLSRESLREVPVILNVAETTRPGRLQTLDMSFLRRLMQRLGNVLHPASHFLQNGRVGGVQALDLACRALQERRCPACIVVGVDSFLTARTLSAYHGSRRLLTPVNSDGFIPGEAAGAVWLEPAVSATIPQLMILGWGYGREAAHVSSDLPLKGIGLTEAITNAFAHGSVGYEGLDYRICDANGEQIIFKEAALALGRTLRVHKGVFDIWHPADCIGEVGAAIVPCALAVGLDAAEKGYAPGPGVLAHFGNDDGQRAAVTLRYESPQRRVA